MMSEESLVEDAMGKGWTRAQIVWRLAIPLDQVDAHIRRIRAKQDEARATPVPDTQPLFVAKWHPTDGWRATPANRDDIGTPDGGAKWLGNKPTINEIVRILNEREPVRHHGE